MKGRDKRRRLKKHRSKTEKAVLVKARDKRRRLKKHRSKTEKAVLVKAPPI